MGTDPIVVESYEEYRDRTGSAAIDKSKQKRYSTNESFANHMKFG